MSIKKVLKESIVLNTISDGIWAGSNIAEIFPATGDTKMSCGIHELFESERIVEKAPVDDILYILEGEIEISSDGVVEKYQAGDFAYLCAGSRQIFTIRNRVKHIYISYPCNWVDVKPCENP
ncbi:MAG: cupin domain-containing protein [bacterium]